MESAGRAQAARDRVPRIDPYGFERPEDFDYAAYEEFFSTYLAILTRRAIKWSRLLKGGGGVQKSMTREDFLSNIDPGVQLTQRASPLELVWLPGVTAGEAAAPTGLQGRGSRRRQQWTCDPGNGHPVFFLPDVPGWPSCRRVYECRQMHSQVIPTTGFLEFSLPLADGVKICPFLPLGIPRHARIPLHTFAVRFLSRTPSQEQAAARGLASGKPLLRCSRTVKRYIRKGVPLEHRARVWMGVSGAQAQMDRNPGYYRHLLQGERDDSLEEAIRTDMNRTFPDNVRFRKGSEPCLQRTLYNVLLAYGHHNRGVGYCQMAGMCVCACACTRAVGQPFEAVSGSRSSRQQEGQCSRPGKRGELGREPQGPCPPALHSGGCRVPAGVGRGQGLRLGAPVPACEAPVAPEPEAGPKRPREEGRPWAVAPTVPGGSRAGTTSAGRGAGDTDAYSGRPPQLVSRVDGTWHGLGSGGTGGHGKE
ncbi:hypothetical protein J1605_009342 [Eschrichtius robustus]|uniref:Rab-GAP TBC domain-containing protein n=1 Tax=Eschrichtius robustus TaxID=9764 RepID=A0AB34GXY2_ESCRO|nr:hypothetical protein J1605_009342 [Eschrichtius robustus]